MRHNSEISNLLLQYADLLLLHSRDEELPHLLIRTGAKLKCLNKDVTEMTRSELAIHFRPEIETLLQEFMLKGALSEVNELIRLTPVGLLSILRTGLLDAKKLAVVWKKGNIETIDALMNACVKGKIARLPGFGPKTENNLLIAIQAVRQQD